MHTPSTIIYNITMQASPSVEAAFMQWLVQEHIPEIMQTGFFKGYNLVRIVATDPSEGNTYALQLYAADMSTYEQYALAHANRINQIPFERWGDRIVTFPTAMEVIH